MHGSVADVYRAVDEVYSSANESFQPRGERPDHHQQVLCHSDFRIQLSRTAQSLTSLQLQPNMGALVRDPISLGLDLVI